MVSAVHDAFNDVLSKPDFTSTAAYHQAQQEVDDAIAELHLHEAILTPKHRNSLAKLSEEDGSLVAGEYGINEVQEQYKLVEKIRRQVLTDTGKIMEGCNLKDLSALTSSLNSLISVYIRSQEKLNKMQEEANLRDAVAEALKTLPEEAREVFFSTLNNFTRKA